MKNKLAIIVAACASILAFSTLSLAQQQKCSEPGSIKRIIKARAGNFETVTFEVVPPSPDFKITNAHRPFENYGGDPVHIKGKYFKEVRFTGVNWTCKISENFSAATTTVTGVAQTEQFEGYVTYIVGYRTKSKYIGQSSTTSGGIRRIVLKFKR
ncbi:MAG: hypothetical protein ACKVQJ_15360 [Pyrinomonadaceae bacterium]